MKGNLCRVRATSGVAPGKLNALFRLDYRSALVRAALLAHEMRAFRLAAMRAKRNCRGAQGVVASALHSLATAVAFLRIRHVFAPFFSLWGRPCPPV